MRTSVKLGSIENMADGVCECCPTELVKMLCKAYADEMTATLQYQMALHLARGAGYSDVAPEYLQHMNEEFVHAGQILKRLEQLDIGITWDYSALQSAGNPWTPITGSNIKEQLEILINAEKGAQAFYAKIVECAGGCKDWITNRLFKQLMSDEAEHELDLKRIYEGL